MRRKTTLLCLQMTVTVLIDEDIEDLTVFNLLADERLKDNTVLTDGGIDDLTVFTYEEI